MIIQNETMQVCFVNTKQTPIKIKRLGYLKIVKGPLSTNTKDWVVYELCEVSYPHPEAPEAATVYLLKFMEIKKNNLLLPAVDNVCLAMEGLAKSHEL